MLTLNVPIVNKLKLGKLVLNSLKINQKNHNKFSKRNKKNLKPKKIIINLHINAKTAKKTLMNLFSLHWHKK